VLGLAPAGAQPGAVADFLAVRGSTLGEVVAAAPAERVVLHRGAVVARTSVVHETSF
jgi:cytosine deaminase